MPRPPFSIRTLLWLPLVVAAFFGQVEFGERRMRAGLAESFWRWDYQLRQKPPAAQS